MDYSIVNSAILTHFGAAVVITVNAVGHAVNAALSLPFSGGGSILGITVEAQAPYAEILEADYIATGAGNGDTLTDANGDVYTIISAKPDGTGMVTLTLRAET